MVTFTCSQFDEVKRLFNADKRSMPADIPLLISFLEKVYSTLRAFETDHAPLARVVPMLVDFLRLSSDTVINQHASALR
jgi:hypothetical protein